MKKNKMLTHDEFLQKIVTSCQERGAKASLCKKTGIKLSTLSQLISKKKKISASTAESLGFKRHIMFEEL